jgi:nucleoid-associated protein YgaU
MGIFDSIKNAFSKSAPAADVTPAPTPQPAPGPDQQTSPQSGQQPAPRQTAQGSSSGPAAATESTGGIRTCTVVSGDTLWRIAERMYGDGSHYMKIFEANTAVLKDPDQIFPGQELVIPEL